MKFFVDLAENEEDDYRIDEEIGYGSFSEVYKAYHKVTNEPIAIKKVIYGPSGTRPPRVDREIQALTVLNGHPNIIGFLGFKETSYEISLHLELCKIDMYDLMLKLRKQNERKSLPLEIVQSVMHGLFNALDACHSTHNMVHRDISPKNMLIDYNGNLKLADFGETRECELTMTPTVGTRYYRAPELLFGSKSYTTAVDMWSAGCVLYELLTVTPLFSGTSDIDQICRIRSVLGTLTEAVWPEVAIECSDWGKLVFQPLDFKPWTEVLPPSIVEIPGLVSLLDGLLRYNPTQRLTAAQSLRHEFFSSLVSTNTFSDSNIAQEMLDFIDVKNN